MRASIATTLLTLCLATAGCMDESRVNTECQWSDADTSALDLSRGADRDHLRTDSKLAGELAVRFADKRVHHVAVLGRPLMEKCRAALFDSITRRHRVAQADVERAALARIWWVDVVFVYLPMALALILATDQVTRRVCRAFEAGDRVIATVSVAALVPIIALIGFGIVQVWAITVESVLLRNGHVSVRVSELPVVRHGWWTFLGGLAICAPAAVWRLARTPLTGTSDSYAARRGRPSSLGKRDPVTAGRG